MATIRKKVWKEYFGKIISGEKKFELRLADFKWKNTVIRLFNLNRRKIDDRKVINFSAIA